MGRKITITLEEEDVPVLLEAIEDHAELGCCHEDDCEACGDIEARCNRVADALLKLAPRVRVS